MAHMTSLPLPPDNQLILKLESGVETPEFLQVDPLRISNNLSFPVHQ
jgi:hypothetical protein